MRGRVKLLLALTACAGLLAADESPTQLMEAGHWKRARAIAEARFKANPNDPEANYLMGRVLMEYGKREEALKYAERAVSLNDKTADYHYLLSGVCGELAERAGIFKQMSLARRFRKEAETTLALDAKHLGAREGLMLFYLKAPGILGGDKKKAHQMADEIASLDPVRGYFARLRLAREEKQTVDVEDIYKKALAADPRSYLAHMALAEFYASDAQKKYDISEQLAKKAMEIEPGRVRAYVLLAAIYSLQDRWQDLDAILLRAEKNVGDNLAPYYNSGRILLTSNKDFSRAERYFRKYLTQEPELGSPDHAAAHWRLGLVLEKQGRKPDAIAEIETALRLRPDFDQAKKDLKRLK